MKPDRSAKIVATIGPASQDREILKQLILAGLDVARLNFSHGTHDEHRRILDNVGEAARRTGIVPAVLQDLQGPKIRIGSFAASGPGSFWDWWALPPWACTPGPSPGGWVPCRHACFPPP